MIRKWIIADDSGWLKVLIDNTRIESLPEFLQVDYEGIKINVPANVQNGSMITTAVGVRVLITPNNRYFRAEDRPGLEREFFTIIEGLYRNKKAGCLTVPPLGWNKLYWYLIKARKGDHQNVGTLQVVRAIR